MIPQLAHPWLPLKMVLVGLPWAVVLIRPVLDALFAAKEADAASSNPLPMAHQPTMDLLSLTGLLLFLTRNARVVAQHAENASFAAGLASKPVARHAAALLIAECGQELAAKS